VLFIPSCPGHTGPVLLTSLTGASHLWDLTGLTGASHLCLWVLVLLVSSWFVWSWFVRFCVGFSFLAGCVLGVFFVLGPREVTEAFWNVCCAAAVATSLTSSVHRSDRCRPREVTEAFWNACCAAAIATGLTSSVHRSDRCHGSDRHWPSV
jgi:hypothetical protein